jgi:hypothetical protein
MFPETDKALSANDTDLGSSTTDGVVNDSYTDEPTSEIFDENELSVGKDCDMGLIPGIADSEKCFCDVENESNSTNTNHFDRSVVSSSSDESTSSNSTLFITTEMPSSILEDQQVTTKSSLYETCTELSKYCDSILNSDVSEPNTSPCNDAPFMIAETSSVFEDKPPSEIEAGDLRETPAESKTKSLLGKEPVTLEQSSSGSETHTGSRGDPYQIPENYPWSSTTDDPKPITDDECQDRFIFEDDLVSDYLNMGRNKASLRDLHDYDWQLDDPTSMPFAEFSREPPDGDAASELSAASPGPSHPMTRNPIPCSTPKLLHNHHFVSVTPKPCSVTADPRGYELPQSQFTSRNFHHKSTHAHESVGLASYHHQSPESLHHTNRFSPERFEDEDMRQRYENFLAEKAYWEQYQEEVLGHSLASGTDVRQIATGIPALGSHSVGNLARPIWYPYSQPHVGRSVPRGMTPTYSRSYSHPWDLEQHLNYDAMQRQPFVEDNSSCLEEEDVCCEDQIHTGPWEPNLGINPRNPSSGMPPDFDEMFLPPFDDDDDDDDEEQFNPEPRGGAVNTFPIDTPIGEEEAAKLWELEKKNQLQDDQIPIGTILQDFQKYLYQKNRSGKFVAYDLLEKFQQEGEESFFTAPIQQKPGFGKTYCIDEPVCVLEAKSTSVGKAQPKTYQIDEPITIVEKKLLEQNKDLEKQIQDIEKEIKSQDSNDSSGQIVQSSALLALRPTIDLVPRSESSKNYSDYFITTARQRKEAAHRHAAARLKSRMKTVDPGQPLHALPSLCFQQPPMYPVPLGDKSPDSSANLENVQCPLDATPSASDDSSNEKSVAALGKLLSWMLGLLRTRTKRHMLSSRPKEL